MLSIWYQQYNTDCPSCSCAAPLLDSHEKLYITRETIHKEPNIDVQKVQRRDAKLIARGRYKRTKERYCTAREHDSIVRERYDMTRVPMI